MEVETQMNRTGKEPPGIESISCKQGFLIDSDERPKLLTEMLLWQNWNESKSLLHAKILDFDERRSIQVQNSKRIACYERIIMRYNNSFEQWQALLLLISLKTHSLYHVSSITLPDTVAETIAFSHPTSSSMNKKLSTSRLFLSLTVRNRRATSRFVLVRFECHEAPSSFLSEGLRKFSCFHPHTWLWRSLPLQYWM